MAQGWTQIVVFLVVLTALVPLVGTYLARVYAFPYATTIRVQCQKHAELVTSDSYTNDVWSYLPDYKAWVTNIYIQGPAWLEGVPECDS